MSLAKQQRVNLKIRRAFQTNFMDGLCNIWRFRKFSRNNDGGSHDYGEAAAYTDVPCRVKQYASDQDAPGLTEFDGTITLPIERLSDVKDRDRLEVTTMGTDALPQSITFLIVDTPRPVATGLVCRIKKAHGEASNG